VHSERILYQIDAGNTGFEVEVKQSRKAKLKEFFTKAIRRRDAKFPPIPEGLKKC
jgi:hypothetical protein